METGGLFELRQNRKNNSPYNENDSKGELMQIMNKKPDDLTVGESVVANVLITAAVYAVAVGGMMAVGGAISGYEKLRAKMRKKSEDK